MGGEGTVMAGLLPPGTYRIGLRADGPTVYRLMVATTPGRLPADEFEDNDTLERAAHMLFEAPVTLTALVRRQWGPGTYDATLHRRGGRLDVDYYRFSTPSQQFFEPTATISGADFDVVVELLDAEGRTIGPPTTVAGGGSHKVPLPADTTCYVRVSGEQETRYQLTTGLNWREGIPKDWEEVEILPQWWLDSSEHRFHDERSWLIDTAKQKHGGVISLVSQQGVELTAQAPNGNKISFSPDESGRFDIVVGDLDPTVVLLTARTSEKLKSAVIVQVPPMRIR